MHKYVYLFSEGNAGMRELLGGKGANLAEMTNIGLPVPQGFTITTEACTRYYEDGRQISPEIQAQIMEYIEKMETLHEKVETRSSGSSIKICLVAEGAADVYPRFAPTMEWDTAAGHAIARAAGKNIWHTDLQSPLQYNKEDLLNPWFIVQ